MLPALAAYVDRAFNRRKPSVKVCIGAEKHDCFDSIRRPACTCSYNPPSITEEQERSKRLVSDAKRFNYIRQVAARCVLDPYCSNRRFGHLPTPLAAATAKRKAFVDIDIE
jgi:hypothetical protein